MLKHMEKALSLIGDRPTLGFELLKQIADRFGGDHGLLLELEETTGGLRELAKFGDLDPMLDQDMRIFAQFAADHPKDKDAILVAPEATSVQKLSARKSVRREMTKSVIVFPLSDGDKSMGAVYLGGHRSGLLKTDELEVDDLLETGAIVGSILGLERTLGQLHRQNRALQKELKREVSFASLIGRSDAMTRIRRALELVAPTDIPVTLIGEPGTGKELAAQALHRESQRGERRLNVLNLSDLPESLMEEMLFGAEPGAGSTAGGRRGAIRESKGGTLVIEGVEKLSLPLQMKLVDAMNKGESLTVGGTAAYTLDVRFIFLLESNPVDLDADGILAREFALKLNLFPVLIPPLRDRVEDLPALVEFYAESASQVFGKMITGVDSDVYDHLGTYSWPGNLDELQQEIRQAILRTPDQSVLKVGALGPKLIGKAQTTLADSGEGTLKQRVASVEKRLIIEALERNNHNQSTTADELGLSRQALINKLQRYGIETGREYKKRRREIAKQASK